MNDDTLLYCAVCGAHVETKAKVYAIVQKRHPFTDEQLDHPYSHLQVYHLECNLVEESLATLSPDQAQAIRNENFANPDGFTFTLDIPTLRGFGSRAKYIPR